MSNLQILANRVYSQQLRILFIILALPALLCCSKGKKQKVDGSAPEKIKQLVPKYIKDCGSCPGIINQVEWRSQTIYTMSCSGPACDCFTYFYDKNGDRFTMDTASLRLYWSESKLIKHIWGCRD